MARNVRLPELLCCPNCGYDLEKARPLKLGRLYIEPFGDIYWKGEEVKLTPSEREVLYAVVAAAKHNSHASKNMIAERIDAENQKIVDVYICKIRDAFRTVDPAFQCLETKWGEGYSWNADMQRKETPVEPPKKLAFEMPSIPLKVFSNSEVLWQGKHRIFLTKRQVELLKILVDANGDFVDSKDIWRPLGLANHGAVGSMVNALRRKFWEADERSQIVENWPGRGYAVVKPDYHRPAAAEVLFENEYIALSHLEMLYKGKYRVHLSKREAQLLLLLAQAEGRWVTNEEIYIKLNLTNGYTTLKTLIHRGINRKMKEFLDEPVVEVMRGHGYRLFMERKRMPAQRFTNTAFDRRGELTMYVTNEVLWQGEHFITLAPNMAKVMSALVQADGAYVTTQTLMQRLGAKDKASVNSEVTRIRKLFATYDAENAIIEAKNQTGYRLVSPVMEEERLAA